MAMTGSFMELLVSQAPGLLLGGLVGFIGSIWYGFVDRLYKEHDRKKVHKLNVARHVLDVCEEGSVHNFEVAPKDIKKVHRTITDVEGFDKEMGKVLNELVSGWLIYSFKQTHLGREFEDLEMRISTGRVLEANRMKLQIWANRIRNGGFFSW